MSPHLVYKFMYTAFYLMVCIYYFLDIYGCKLEPLAQPNGELIFCFCPYVLLFIFYPYRPE